MGWQKIMITPINGMEKKIMITPIHSKKNNDVSQTRDGNRKQYSHDSSRIYFQFKISDIYLIYGSRQGLFGTAMPYNVTSNITDMSNKMWNSVITEGD